MIVRAVSGWNLSRRVGVVLSSLALLSASMLAVMTPATPAQGAVCLSTFSNRTTADGLGDTYSNGVHVDGSKVYVATGDLLSASGGLGISTDGGVTFTNRTTAEGLGANIVMGVFADGSSVYAATERGLSISTNGGASFTNRTNANSSLGDDRVYDVYAEGSNVYAATSGGGLSISTDGGATFTNRTTADGLGGNLFYGVFADGLNVYAAGTGLSISTDGGATFTNRTTADGLGHPVVRDVYVDGSNVYAATAGGLSISTDGGATFTNRTTANGLGSNSLFEAFADGSKVYVATTGGLSISADCPTSNTSGSASSSSSRDAGLPGIYLHVAGSQRDIVSGTAIHHGAYAVAPNSPYSLTVEPRVSGTGSKRVLATGVTSQGGHVEEIAQLGALPAGSYKIVMVSYSVGGQPLVLTNHIDVDANGRFVSVSPESAQPLLK